MLTDEQLFISSFKINTFLEGIDVLRETEELDYMIRNHSENITGGDGGFFIFVGEFWASMLRGLAESGCPPP